MNARHFFAPLLAAIVFPAAAACPSVLDHRFKTLQGKPADLCQYQGKVVLVVNTASFCGYTPQYQGLEAIYQKYKGQGLVVLGFPSNDFGGQEPGTNEQVADFCERTYQVKFPMLEKTVVTGKDANPVYQELAAKTGQPPQWNFHKYLVARDGAVLASYPSTMKPEDSKLSQAIENALKDR